MNELPWFRFYTDFLGNERIQLLSFDDQRHYVALLCLKGRGSIEKFQGDRDLQLMAIAKSLGLDPLTCDEVRFRLMKVGLIGEDWQPLGWDERQFLTDDPDYNAEKQKRYRARKRKSTKTKGKSKSVTTALPRVTVPETDTESDTESEKGIARKRAPQNFAPDLRMYEWAESELGLSADQVQQQTAAFKDHEFKSARKDWPAAWRNWMRRYSDWRKDEAHSGGNEYEAILERNRKIAGLK